jgi:hypothetical protein
VPLGQPPQDEQDLDAFVRPSVPPGDPARQPLRKLFDPADDPKGWDRASLRLNTHPLHPVRRLSQTDFLLPSATNLLKLLGDSAIFGATLAVLSYFPLWMTDIMVQSDLSTWVWGTMATVAGGGAGLVLLAAWAERNPQPY